MTSHALRPRVTPDPFTHDLSLLRGGSFGRGGHVDLEREVVDTPLSRTGGVTPLTPTDFDSVRELGRSLRAIAAALSTPNRGGLPDNVTLENPSAYSIGLGQIAFIVGTPAAPKAIAVGRELDLVDEHAESGRALVITAMESIYRREGHGTALIDYLKAHYPKVVIDAPLSRAAVMFLRAEEFVFVGSAPSHLPIKLDPAERIEMVWRR